MLWDEGKIQDFLFFSCTFENLVVPLHPLKANNGQSYTTSSLGILQDGNVAKVLGCSGAI